MMQNRDPRDGNFCPYQTIMINTFSCIPFIYLLIYLFHEIKCIQCIGFIRYASMHILHVLTAAVDAN